MSKELGAVEINHFDTIEIDQPTELVKLDDLSLALIGGGECPVAL